jgi:hypothetical protein
MRADGTGRRCDNGRSVVEEDPFVWEESWDILCNIGEDEETTVETATMGLSI